MQPEIILKPKILAILILQDTLRNSLKTDINLTSSVCGADSEIKYFMQQPLHVL